MLEQAAAFLDALSRHARKQFHFQMGEAALDQLYDTDPAGYSEFIYAIEAAIECTILTRDDRSYDMLMFAVPVLTWSRFSIPSGPIAAPILANFRVQLQAHVLAADVRFALADCLFSPDQLPRGYHLTHELAAKLWAAKVFYPDLNLADATPKTVNGQIAPGRWYTVSTVITGKSCARL